MRLGFTKYGHDGVHIEGRRNGGEWALLAATNAKPYIDKRPLLVPGTPELREYRLRFWDKGEPNGEYSAVLTMTVGI